VNKLILKCEVESAFVESRGGVNAKGKTYEIHSQKVWVYLGSKFPKEIQVLHDDPRNAYAPGLYEVDLLPSLDVGDFGKLIVDGRRFVLIAASVETPVRAVAK